MRLDSNLHAHVENVGPLWQNPWTDRHQLPVLPLIGLLILTALAPPVLAHQAEFDLRILPDLGGGASRVTSLSNVDSDNMLRAVGEARTASGNWRAVIWRSSDGGNMWDAHVLPSLGYSSTVAYDVTIMGNPTGKVVVAGAFYDEDLRPGPMQWQHTSGEHWIAILLPMLDGGQSGTELTCDVGPQGRVMGAGWSENEHGVRRAVVWEPDGLGGWVVQALPSLYPGADAQANTIEGGDILGWHAAGFTHDDLGRMLPAVWDQVNEQWRLTILALPNDADGAQAVEFGGEDLGGGSGGDLILVGSYQDVDGFSHALKWHYNDVYQRWDMSDLPDLPGYSNGQALSITTDGKAWQHIVGSCDNGLGSSVATQWVIDDVGNVTDVDLKQVTVGADDMMLEIGTAAGISNFEWGLPIIAVNGSRIGLEDDPHAFVLLEPRLNLHEPSRGIPGQETVIRIERCTPFEKIHVIRGLFDGVTNIPSCPGSQLHMGDPEIAGVVTADAGGVAELNVLVPPLASGKRVLLHAVEHNNCEVSNLVEFTFE